MKVIVNPYVQDLNVQIVSKKSYQKPIFPRKEPVNIITLVNNRIAYIKYTITCTIEIFDCVNFYFYMCFNFIQIL